MSYVSISTRRSIYCYIDGDLLVALARRSAALGSSRERSKWGLLGFGLQECKREGSGLVQMSLHFHPGERDHGGHVGRPPRPGESVGTERAEVVLTPPAPLPPGYTCGGGYFLLFNGVDTFCAKLEQPDFPFSLGCKVVPLNAMQGKCSRRTSTGQCSSTSIMLFLISGPYLGRSSTILPGDRPSRTARTASIQLRPGLHHTSPARLTTCRKAPIY